MHFSVKVNGQGDGHELQHNHSEHLLLDFSMHMHTYLQHVNYSSGIQGECKNGKIAIPYCVVYGILCVHCARLKCTAAPVEPLVVVAQACANNVEQALPAYYSSHRYVYEITMAIPRIVQIDLPGSSATAVKNILT